MARIGFLGADYARMAAYDHFLKTLSDVQIVPLLDAHLDAVLICAPLDERAALVEKAAGLAKHVLCAVPFASTQAEAEHVLTLCSEWGVRLIPALALRFAPPLLELKKLLDGGSLGQLLGAKVTCHAKPSSGEGVVLQHAPQILDLLRWLTDADVIDIYAEIGFGALRPRRAADDVALFSLGLTNQMYATVDVSCALPESYPTPENLKIEFIGTGGLTRLDTFYQHIDVYNDGAARSHWGSPAERELLRAFVDSLDGGALALDPQDALIAQRIALAGFESAETGGVVALRTEAG